MSMFSSALKSFSSNITSNYSVSSTPSTTAGPWKIFDAKKKGTNKHVSVFVFERKSLEANAGAGFSSSRSGGSGLKRLHEEVVERLKKEASSLARLRHPSILELAEPVEESRSGGLMFATEQVTVSLAGLLEDKDSQESQGGVGGRRSRYVVEDPESGGRKRREVEIDELEIQKGLLQVGKGLEFLHESAGIVHANLTPDAIFINAKGDWKIAGLGFATPPDHSTQPTSVTPISLSEVLNYDARLPRSVQLNLDYSSPDFVVDTNITTSADMFSLGLVIIALYNSPHRSPIETGHSISTYKRVFASPSTVPTINNNFLTKQTLPKDIKAEVLPKLITRRPANRLSAREFQQAQYFDNILVSTIRFLESLPAKTPAEKQQFLRGLPKIINQFPKSVLEKKVIPALLEETKDTDLLSLIFQNIFKTIPLVPSGRRVLSEQVLPRLRDVFLTTSNTKAGQERDSAKEGGLMVVLEHMSVITENTSGKEFKDDVLPILYKAIQSSTASLVDQALGTLSLALPILDFSTIKNELFPTIAIVFAKTSSMTIKIRGLQAFAALCGGITETAERPDDFSGMVQQPKKSTTSSAALDKYTVQEKVVPLLKGIKTKEPAVMMAALDVFKQVGKVADSDFLAIDVLPTLWTYSLGPLLNLEQFQAFMALIKSLSSKIEQEQTRKLSELSTTSSSANRAHSSTTPHNGLGGGLESAEGDTDFESLVSGRAAKSNEADLWGNGDWGSESAVSAGIRRNNAPSSDTAAFSWSTPATTSAPGRSNLHVPPNPSRTITPDLTMSSFAALTPTTPSTATSSVMTPPLQPSSASMWAASAAHRPAPQQAAPASGAIDWSKAAASNPWSSPPSSSTVLQPQAPLQPNYSGFNIAPPPGGGGASRPGMMMQPVRANNTQRPQQPKSGLDKYESLI